MERILEGSGLKSETNDNDGEDDSGGGGGGGRGGRKEGSIMFILYGRARNEQFIRQICCCTVELTSSWA